MLDDEEIDRPTEYRDRGAGGKDKNLSSSDSDVRLVLDDDLLATPAADDSSGIPLSDSDSDVRLTLDDDSQAGGSDSDVKLVGSAPKKTPAATAT